MIDSRPCLLGQVLARDPIGASLEVSIQRESEESRHGLDVEHRIVTGNTLLWHDISPHKP